MNNEKQELSDFRCRHCGKLFFKGDLDKCTIEIKCKYCKMISRFDYDNGKSFLQSTENFAELEDE